MRNQRLVKALIIIVALFVGTCTAYSASQSSHRPSKHTKMRRQTWNLKNADINAVINTVSILTGKSFIVDPKVKGKVSFISQKPMTIPEIYQSFLSMLQVAGYAAVPSGRVTKIVPLVNAKGYGGRLATQAHPVHGDQVTVRVIPIKHVSANQLVPVIRSMMQPWAMVSAYMPSNSLILVGSAENLSRLVTVISRMDSQGASITTVYRLKHSNAKNLVSILQSLQSGSRSEGRIVNVALAADEQSNSVLINGNLANTTRMKYLIRKLDKPIAGGNTLVVHLNYLNAKKLAPVLLKVATGEQSTTLKGKNVALGAPGISVQAEENDNAIIIHGPARLLHSLRKVIRQLDVQPDQVLVEAIIVKINQTLLNQLGIVWGTVDSGGDSTSVVDPSTGTATSSNEGGSTLSSPNVFAMKVTHGVGFISGGNLGAIIHALNGNTSSDILATPSIVVLNNQKATISDGKNIGIINRQYSSTVAGTNNEITPFNTIQRHDVTLSLKVTPQISPNNIIRLKIEQQNDSIDPSSTGDIENPILDVSKITTNVLVRSGDILVLGGLINNNHIVAQQKIPILGDIPLIGRLFRYNSHRSEKQNLMVFIKPIIMNSQLRMHQQTRRRYNYMRSQEIALQHGSKLHNHIISSILPQYPDFKEHTFMMLPPPAIPPGH